MAHTAQRRSQSEELGRPIFTEEVIDQRLLDLKGCEIATGLQGGPHRFNLPLMFHEFGQDSRILCFQLVAHRSYQRHKQKHQITESRVGMFSAGATFTCTSFASCTFLAVSGST
jgi:hypothetical protein